jgi:hypothetical protein
MAPPSFHTVPEPQRVARCDECGALVDASEDGRRLHTRWHLSDDPLVIDLTEREPAIAIV